MKSKWKPPFWVGDKLFTQEDMDLIHWTTRQYPELSITELARRICENLEWKAPNGKERVHSGVELLENLEAEGILTLPGKRQLAPYNQSAPEKMKQDNRDELLKQIFQLVTPFLDEKQRRLLAGAEAMAIGDGGIERVAELLHMSIATVSQGMEEARNPETITQEGVRKAGGGRKANPKKDPE